MLLIPCPYCGDRPELEFHCGGEAHIDRPEKPMQLDDAAWAAFLFYRANTKGVTAERWCHVHGCQRWFNALRNTISDDILATYEMGHPRPVVPSGEGQALARNGPDQLTPDLSKPADASTPGAPRDAMAGERR